MAEAEMAVTWPRARRAVSEAEERGADSVVELREGTALLRPRLLLGDGAVGLVLLH